MLEDAEKGPSRQGQRQRYRPNHRGEKGQGHAVSPCKPRGEDPHAPLADEFGRAAVTGLTTALRIARTRGNIAAPEFAAIDATLDRVRAMLSRLTHKRAGLGAR